MTTFYIIYVISALITIGVSVYFSYDRYKRGLNITLGHILGCFVITFIPIWNMVFGLCLINWEKIMNFTIIKGQK